MGPLKKHRLQEEQQQAQSTTTAPTLQTQSA
jgi:hypothetical protein